MLFPFKWVESLAFMFTFEGSKLIGFLNHPFEKLGARQTSFPKFWEIT